jgi:hypothetical protein
MIPELPLLKSIELSTATAQRDFGAVGKILPCNKISDRCQAVIFGAISGRWAQAKGRRGERMGEPLTHGGASPATTFLRTG